MAEFLVFVYALAAMFVLQALRRDRRQRRPSAPIVTMAGWGLFSLSSTLAVLLGAVALALALGVNMPLPQGFDTPLF